MANIEMEEKETLEQRIQLLQGKKQDILAILANWSYNHQSQPDVEQMSKKLNDLLFEEIIATNECTCQQCEQKVCLNKNARNCSLNKGDKTRILKAKTGFQRKWKEVVQKLQQNMPDQNFEMIKDLAIEGLKQGLYKKMEKERG